MEPKLKNNAEITRHALYELKISTGKVDWIPVQVKEGLDVKIVRDSVMLTRLHSEGRWEAHIIGYPHIHSYGESAPEAYILLRMNMQSLSNIWRRM